MSRNFITEEFNPPMNTDTHRFFLSQKIKKIRFLSMCICLYLWVILLFACSSTPTDLRTLAPAESLIYLETNDLGKMLDKLTEGKAFQQLAKNKPDFSALKNIQIAVAVTGFESSENQVTAENSVLNYKPRFVAIADTHAWNWQALAFTEEKIGKFVNETLDGKVTLKTADKSGGKYFTWSANDEKKLVAFVQDSRIYFGNDETAIEKCLAVFRGESESFAKNGRTFERAENTLAFGYVSSEGIAQISNVAGISTAIETTDNDEGRGFIARVLPQIIQKSVKEIVWTATKTERGVEDKFTVALTTEAASIFNQTLFVSPQIPNSAIDFVPTDVFFVTRYNLQNPQIAWRSLLLVTSKNSDATSANILTQNSKSLLESYDISDAETFLGAVGTEILTVNFDAESEKSVTIVSVKDADKLKKSIAGINFKASAEKNLNAEIWRTDDKLTAAALVENKLILGDAESVIKCLQAKQNGQNFMKNPAFKFFSESKAVAVTFGSEIDSAQKMVEVLTELKDENGQLTTHFLTETRFNEKGFERKTVSDFGLIGGIIEKFNE
ncbi:hypothetical protein BH10ACI1_BH10ACI1_15620 [soil metagenome]